jgi:DNA repair protein RadC
MRIRKREVRVVYRLPAIHLAVVRERTVTAGTRAIRRPRDAAAVAREFIGDYDREHVVALLLDAKHRVLALHTVAVGHLDSAPVHPREVFKAALLVNAAALILAHNHPSGDPEASRADRDLTRRIAHAGALLGIPVLDHVIIGVDGYTSLREQGVIAAP